MDIKIDFKALAVQKSILIEMIDSWDNSGDNERKLKAKEAEGLLNLIDAIQDQAVDSGEFSEDSVFDEISIEDIQCVVKSLSFEMPTQKQIDHVFNCYNDMIISDPTGYPALWIEQLLHNAGCVQIKKS